MKEEKDNHRDSINRSEYFSQQIKILREAYRSKFPEKILQMEHLLQELNRDREEEQNIFEAFRFIHSLKGSSGTYGFPLLSQLCLKLEKILRAAHKGEMPVEDSLMDLLSLWLETVRDKIDLILEEDSVSGEVVELMEKLERFVQ